MHNNNIGFHIEPTNICTLKCPGCARTRFIDQWGKHWKNHSVDVNQLMDFLDCNLAGVTVQLCGNTGDPIYHNDFHQLVSALKHRDAIVEIHTNGSYRTQAWWLQLCDILDHHDTVIFSIDGLPTTFTQYRINADWNSVAIGIEVVAKSTAKTIWKFIPFKFNQNNIEQAQALSLSMGVDEFKVVASDRFDEQTQYLKPDPQWLGRRYQPQSLWKQSVNSQQHTVNPECANNKMHYISAEGYYIPCCYLGDFRFYYKTQFWKSKNQYSIAHNKFSAIVNSAEFKTFTDHLDQQPGCQFNCPQTQ